MEVPKTVDFMTKQPHSHYGPGQILELGDSCSLKGSQGGCRDPSRPLLSNHKWGCPRPLITHICITVGQILDPVTSCSLMGSPRERSQKVGGQANKTALVPTASGRGQGIRGLQDPSGSLQHRTM